MGASLEACSGVGRTSVEIDRVRWLDEAPAPTDSVPRGVHDPPSSSSAAAATQGRLISAPGSGTASPRASSHLRVESIRLEPSYRFAVYGRDSAAAREAVLARNSATGGGDSPSRGGASGASSPLAHTTSRFADPLTKCLVKRFPFTGLDETAVAKCVSRFKETTFPDGARVINEGDEWLYYSVLAAGTLDVVDAAGQVVTADIVQPFKGVLGESEIMFFHNTSDVNIVARETVPGAGVVIMRMPARTFRGVYNYTVDEIKDDPDLGDESAIKDKVLRGLKKSSTAGKLRDLLPTVGAKKYLSMACSLLEAQSGEVVRRRYTSASDLTAFSGSNGGFTERKSGQASSSLGDAAKPRACADSHEHNNLYMVVVGQCMVSISGSQPSGASGGAQNAADSKDDAGSRSCAIPWESSTAGNDTAAAAAAATQRVYSSGDIFEHPNDEIRAVGGKTCQLLRLSASDVETFFEGEPLELIRQWSQRNDLKSRLEQIHQGMKIARAEAKRRKKAGVSADQPLAAEATSTSAPAAPGPRARKYEKLVSLKKALKSCNMESERSSRTKQVPLGRLTFRKGTMLLRNGSLADSALAERTLCGEPCPSFVLHTGKVAVLPPDYALGLDLEDTAWFSEIPPEHILTPGPEGYICVNPGDSSFSYRKDVWAIEDTDVFVVRLLQRRANAPRKGTRFASELGVCCCAAPSKSQKGATGKPMRESSLSSRHKQSIKSGKSANDTGFRDDDDDFDDDDDDGDDLYRNEYDAISAAQHWERCNAVHAACLGMHGQNTSRGYSQTSSAGALSDPDMLIGTQMVRDEDVETWFEFPARPIGKGMVGNVYCVRPKVELVRYAAEKDGNGALTSVVDGLQGRIDDAHMYFAAKVMRKEDIVNKKQTKAVLWEKHAMSKMAHPFIVQMYATWQTPRRLIMLLDFMPGGELYLCGQRKFPSLSPFAVRFYSACVVSALTYLHDELGYIYRDLKGENILIDRQGYAKIVDFGFAKKLRNNDDGTWGRAHTVCGTPDYMAPEIIGAHARYRNRSPYSRGGYGPAVDFWALGVLIYEKVYKLSPFSDGGKHKKFPQIFANIMNDEYRIADGPRGPHEQPGRMEELKLHDPDCYDIISQLLTRNPIRRLGFSRTLAGSITVGGGSDIKVHPFFAGSREAAERGYTHIDFDLLERKALAHVPWVPEIKPGESQNKFMRKKVKAKPTGRVVPPGELGRAFDEWGVLHKNVERFSLRGEHSGHRSSFAFRTENGNGEQQGSKGHTSPRLSFAAESKSAAGSDDVQLEVA